jgi:hypothetical protein
MALPTARTVLSSLALLAGTAIGVASPALGAGPTVAPTVRVTLPPLTEGEPFTGWMTLYLMEQDANLPPAFTPADGPFLDDPQPMYSMYVEGARAGDVIEFRPTLGFPGPFAVVDPGKYRGQVVLDREQTHTSWLHEYSNLYTPIRWFEIDDQPQVVQFPIVNNGFHSLPLVPGVESFEIESPTMSAFMGDEASIKVSVLYPRDYDPEREYATVYVMPGFAITREFGGDEREAYLFGAERARTPEKHDAIWDDAFLVTVSPIGAWGHSLFSDSPANGPIGTAFVNDVIPAIEERFPVSTDPATRLLMGHGSGGWAAIWLQMNYPEVFGGAWASSPDPVDFRAFFGTDIYSDRNFFLDENGKHRAFYRSGGVVRATNREAAAMEEVMGPGLTSAKQLAGWQAAFGPINASGDAPARLFDPVTGDIDPQVAQAWRERDIGDMLRSRSEEYGPIFRDKIHIMVGDADNFSFNKSVELLAKDLRSLGYTGGSGYVVIEEGLEFGAAETQTRERMYNEMRRALEAAGIRAN